MFDAFCCTILSDYNREVGRRIGQRSCWRNERLGDSSLEMMMLYMRALAENRPLAGSVATEEVQQYRSAWAADRALSAHWVPLSEQIEPSWASPG